MNKKEVFEIRRLLTEKRCPFTRIAGCYVNAEKEIVASFKEAFLSLEQEEMLKYFDLIKKGLSGTIGKNLLNLEFPLETEAAGGPQADLLALRDDELHTDEMLDAYYHKVIDSYDFAENYLILIVHGAYDVPGRASDQSEMFDASDTVYSFIFSCICPVALSKPGLSWDDDQMCFRNRIRDRVVDRPATAFLFPAFNDRASDIHSLLYYSKNADDLHYDFVDQMMGCQTPPAAQMQKETFTVLVEEALGEECDFDTVIGLHNQLRELTQEHKDSPDPVILGQNDVKNLLSLSGADEEQMEHFDSHFEHAAGEDASFVAANIMSTSKLEVRTGDVVVSISPDRSELIERREVDGRMCLVIPITDDVRVNGIVVRPGKPDKE